MGSTQLSLAPKGLLCHPLLTSVSGFLSTYSFQINLGSTWMYRVLC